MCFPIVKLDANKLFDKAMYKLCPPGVISGFGYRFDSRVLISLLTHPVLIWIGVVMALFTVNLVFLALNTIFCIFFIVWNLRAWRLPEATLVYPAQIRT